MLPLLLTLAAHAGTCPDRLDAAAFDARIAEAEARYAALDPEGFLAAREQVLLALDCTDALTPVVATRLHRLQALTAFTSGQDQQTQWSLAAWRRLEPEATLPEALVPAGHDLHGLAAEDALEPASALRVDPADGLEVTVDGSAAVRVPTDAAVLLQATPSDGAVQSAYHYPDQPLPSFVVARPERNRAVVPALVAAGTGLVFGAVGLVDLASGQSDYQVFLETEDHERAEQIWAESLEPRRTRVAAELAIASVGVTSGLVLFAAF